MEWLFPGDECANERKKRKCLDAQNWRFQKSLNELTSWTASMLHQQCYTVALQHCFTTALLHCCTTALLLLQHNCAEDDQEEMCKEKEEVSQGQNKNCKSWKITKNVFWKWNFCWSIIFVAAIKWLWHMA